MPDDAMLIHNEHGVPQALRRRLLLLICEDEQDRAAAEGQTVTWTEEPDGVTLYVDGVQDSRVTYAELAHLEQHPEDCP